MKYVCKVLSLRRAVVLFSLLLLVQLPAVLSSRLIQSASCGTYSVSSASNSGHELFYVNDKLVDRQLFCKTLKIYMSNHCFSSTKVVNRYCWLNLALDELPLESARKPLQRVITVETTKHQTSLSDEENDHKPVLRPKNLAMAVPGMFVLCCAFLCPCFRARRKEAEHAAVLSKEPVSIDSLSSLEMSVSEKVPASPMRVPPSPSRFSMSPKLNRIGSVHLSMSQAATATQNFSPSLRLGEGGFGTVYKGRLRDGQVVAIKRAKKEHFEAIKVEFKTEVELLAKIDHRNLVKLLGYVDKGNDCLIITEYVPNGTLRDHLDGLRGNPLDFNQRLEISIDVAHGLTYLHQYAEKKIIHRDILTGRRPVEPKRAPEERVTIRWAFTKYESGNMKEILDPSMGTTVDRDTLKKMFDLAFRCVAPTRADRPEMKTVGEQLWGIRMDYLRSRRIGNH
ncbi:Protein kinase domain-containing protein [Heracleum sosnowskyi]|uniref:Protein kinase domain-containing protein n=1 Tax=Heracleum sosnowskyi TaxID=360622 RepID=A0AAD8JCP8_9APIA|nr:Protein kinase domain-containing protein [Heracleum sosnowskyi]